MLLWHGLHAVCQVLKQCNITATDVSSGESAHEGCTKEERRRETERDEKRGEDGERGAVAVLQDSAALQDCRGATLQDSSGSVGTSSRAASSPHTRQPTACDAAERLLTDADPASQPSQPLLQVLERCLLVVERVRISIRKTGLC